MTAHLSYPRTDDTGWAVFAAGHDSVAFFDADDITGAGQYFDFLWRVGYTASRRTIEEYDRENAMAAR